MYIHIYNTFIRHAIVHLHTYFWYSKYIPQRVQWDLPYALYRMYRIWTGLPKPRPSPKAIAEIFHRGHQLKAKLSAIAGGKPQRCPRGCSVACRAKEALQREGTAQLKCYQVWNLLWVLFLLGFLWPLFCKINRQQENRNTRSLRGAAIKLIKNCDLHILYN